MSQPFDNATSVPKCECPPDRTTGYINADTDTIHCNNCDGVISTASELTLADLEKYDKAYQAWAFDQLGEDVDYLDIEREVAEVREAINDELNERSMKSSQALTDYCKPFRGEMGLVSDECRQSDEYKVLKQNYNADFQSLREFNQATRKNKDLQKAIKAEIMQRRTKATK